MTVIEWEKLATMREEMLPCVVSQWHESGTDKDDVPLDVDWDRYQAIEDAGVFRLLSARRDGILAGYAAYFITNHMMYRTTPHVMCDGVYARLNHRGVGIMLVRAAEKKFRELMGDKTFRIIYSGQIISDFPKILTRLNYKARESVHFKLMRSTS